MLDDDVVRHGRKIFSNVVWNLMQLTGRQLEQSGYTETPSKPNLFYKKVAGGTVYADMRGSKNRRNPIWMDPRPHVYAFNTPWHVLDKEKALLFRYGVNIPESDSDYFFTGFCKRCGVDVIDIIDWERIELLQAENRREIEGYKAGNLEYANKVTVETIRGCEGLYESYQGISGQEMKDRKDYCDKCRTTIVAERENTREKKSAETKQKREAVLEADRNRLSEIEGKIASLSKKSKWEILEERRDLVLSHRIHMNWQKDHLLAAIKEDLVRQARIGLDPSIFEYPE